MSKEEIAKELQHDLKLYAIANEERYLVGVITYAGMLVGKTL